MGLLKPLQKHYGHAHFVRFLLSPLSFLSLSAETLNLRRISLSGSLCLLFISAVLPHTIMASTTEPTVLKKEEEEEDEKPLADDEDTGAQIAPIVQLQEIAVTTGEENEDIILDLKSKLYRFDKEANQWKERGVGTVKLLKHKETGKVRLVMRQNKTLKICANHLVLPTMTVQEHHGNEKSCVWHAADFADGELKEENFCIRFPSIENCKSFKDKIEEITESLAKSSGESEEGTTAANLIEKLTVEEKDTEEKTEAKEAPLSSEEKKEKSSDEK